VYIRRVFHSTELGQRPRRLHGRHLTLAARAACFLFLVAGGWATVAGCSSSDQGAPPPAVQPVEAGHHQEAGVKFACTNPQDFLSFDGQPTGYILCSNGVSGPLHRQEIKACPSTLPRSTTCIGVGSGTDAGHALGDCKNDTDCTTGIEGHCQTTQRNTACACYYGCKADADCGAGKVCVCGNMTGECVKATCTSDADCGPGKLCLSASDGACSKVYACQSVKDTCAGDKECKGQYSQCTFTGDHRECKQPPNCGF
jgi:hypothetical protein